VQKSETFGSAQLKYAPRTFISLSAAAERLYFAIHLSLSLSLRLIGPSSIPSQMPICSCFWCMSDLYINKAFTFLIGGANTYIKLARRCNKMLLLWILACHLCNELMHLVSRHSYYICAGDCFLGPAFCAIVLPPPRPREIDRLQVPNPNHQIQIDIMNACSWVALFACAVVSGAWVKLLCKALLK
jgi:hypothetical protein